MTCEIGEECTTRRRSRTRTCEESLVIVKIVAFKPSNADKWRYTLYTTVLFLIISSPYTYKLVNSIIGKLSNMQ